MNHNQPYTVQFRDVIDNPLDDNIEVRVEFASGEVYDASYFTLTNLHTIMNRHTTTGENTRGTYFWWPHMVIVRELTRESIETSIKDLLEEEEFESIFERITEEECETVQAHN